MTNESLLTLQSILLQRAREDVLVKVEREAQKGRREGSLGGVKERWRIRDEEISMVSATEFSPLYGFVSGDCPMLL